MSIGYDRVLDMTKYTEEEMSELYDIADTLNRFTLDLEEQFWGDEEVVYTPDVYRTFLYENNLYTSLCFFIALEKMTLDSLTDNELSGILNLHNKYLDITDTD